MGLIDSGIEGLAALLRAAAEAEFRTVMGLANFVLTLAVLGVFAARAPMLRAWNLLMWALDLLFGSSPERPQPIPRLPSFPKVLAHTLVWFALCVVTVVGAAG